MRSTVSVVIPAYNARKYLSAAVESVLAQSRPADEIILVDDGSTDDTVAVAESFNSRVVLLRQANAGAGAARNLAIQHASGDCIALLDADDLWHPEKLALQMAMIETQPAIDIVFGSVRQFYSPELGYPQEAHDKLARETAGGILPSSCLMRRQAFHRAGPFNAQLRIGEFIDWYARAMEAGLKSHVLPEILVERRIHTTNLGVTQRDNRSDYLLVVRAAMERRKAAASAPQSKPAGGESGS
jgi:glycosyltransferase involved in cell wall biosynthesis